MLPAAWKFSARNATGQVIAASKVVVYIKRKRLQANAHSNRAVEAVVYDSEATVVVNAAQINNAAVATSAAVASNGFSAADCVLEVTGHASASGDVTLYFERASDATGTHIHPAGTGTVVATITMSGAGPSYAAFELT
jgi:hypothetical protein